MQLLELFLFLGSASAALVDRGYPAKNPACSKYQCIQGWSKAAKWCMLAEPYPQCRIVTTTKGATATVTSVTTSHAAGVLTVSVTSTKQFFADCSPPPLPNQEKEKREEKQEEKRAVANSQQLKYCGQPPACLRNLSPQQQRSACSCAHLPVQTCTKTVTRAPRPTTTTSTVVEYSTTKTVTVFRPTGTFAIAFADSADPGNGGYAYSLYQPGMEADNRLVAGDFSAQSEIFKLDNGDQLFGVSPFVYGSSNVLVKGNLGGDPGAAGGQIFLGTPQEPNDQVITCFAQHQEDSTCSLSCVGHNANGEEFSQFYLYTLGGGVTAVRLGKPGSSSNGFTANAYAVNPALVGS